MTSARWNRTRDRLLRPPRKPKPMGLVAVQMSINPFELYLLIAVCLVGLLYMIGLVPPNSVRTLLPPIAVQVWAANLGLGGATALIGGLWSRHLDRGLAAYQFGWGLVGVGTLVYGLSLALLYPVQGLAPGLENLVFAAGCFTRVLQVQRFFALSAEVIKGTAARERP